MSSCQGDCLGATPGGRSTFKRGIPSAELRSRIPGFNPDSISRAPACAGESPKFTLLRAARRRLAIYVRNLFAGQAVQLALGLGKIRFKPQRLAKLGDGLMASTANSQCPTQVEMQSGIA